MVLVRLPHFPFLPTLPCKAAILETFPLTSHSTVISAFAIIILGILGLLFNAEHPELVGSIDDPEDGHQVAATVFIAVMIYAVSPATTIGNPLRGLQYLYLSLLLPRDFSCFAASKASCTCAKADEARLRCKDGQGALEYTDMAFGSAPSSITAGH